MKARLNNNSGGLFLWLNAGCALALDKQRALPRM